MRASKVSLKVGVAALRPLRQSINSAMGASSATRKQVKMNPRQLQLMMDSGVSQSLKTLIKTVSELQGTRKFEHLLPKHNAPKPVNLSTLRAATSARDVNSKITKKYENKELQQVTEQRADQHEATSQPHATYFMYKTPMDRLTEAVRSLTVSISGMLPLMTLQGGKTGIGHFGKGKGLPSNEIVNHPHLSAFRDGMAKSSNVDQLQPVRNWALCNTQQLLHSSLSDAPGSRKFSTSSLLLAKKDSKDCKKKGGSLPCLQSTGIVKQEKDRAGSNKICEKFCMPCCPPARDPPECVVAQKKRECKKFRAPRPSYSECKKDPMKPIKPCECLIQRLPPCGLGESKSSKAC